MGPLPLRVMCIDDNRDAADSAALLLGLYGCDVSVCYDGPTALAEALKFGPDVCLIDLNMPGMSGCELARHLKAWRRDRPVYLVAVTAYGSQAVREQTAKAGFARHLVKPVDWEELSSALSTLERQLGRAELVSGRSRRGSGH
ncbi:MAG TPA: response regulator [Gemmataceae bacterium]|nr:response regulator [Gemmataceae bacterium]